MEPPDFPLLCKGVMMSTPESVQGRKRTNSANTHGKKTVSQAKRPLNHGDDRLVYISEAAYFKAQARGFTPGHEMDDWLAAEKEFE